MMRVILDTRSLVLRFYREPLFLSIEEVLEGVFWIIQSTHDQERRLDNFIATLQKEMVAEERDLLPVFRQIVWRACEDMQQICERSGLYHNGEMPYSFESLHRDDVVAIHNHYRTIQPNPV